MDWEAAGRIFASIISNKDTKMPGRHLRTFTTGLANCWSLSSCQCLLHLGGVVYHYPEFLCRVNSSHSIRRDISNSVKWMDWLITFLLWFIGIHRGKHGGKWHQEYKYTLKDMSVSNILPSNKIIHLMADSCYSRLYPTWCDWEFDTRRNHIRLTCDPLMESRSSFFKTVRENALHWWIVWAQLWGTCI